VLYRLLKDSDPNSYCLLSIAHDESRSRPTTNSVADAGNATAWLEGKYLSLPTVQPTVGFHDWIRRGYAKIRRYVLASSSASAAPSSGGGSPNVTALPRPSWKRRFKSLIVRADRPPDPTAQVRQRAAAILRIIREEKCNAIVACSGDLVDIPAAWDASQRAGVPFYAYLFDDYLEQWTTPWQRQFAHKVFPPIVRQAAGLIVPNEFLARSYQAKFSVNAVVVPNPVAEVNIQPKALTQRSCRRPLRIVYTGAIYEAHFDCFRHLLQAIRQSPAGDFELHIYTAMDLHFLDRHGIGAPAAFHPAVSAEEAKQLQRDADVLFLPLAFESPYPEIIRTSAPGKMGELLASGRPVLVHAPRNSFVSSYCRSNECAIVVDEPMPEALQQALARVTRDRTELETIVHNAVTCSSRDFSPALARSRFYDFIRDGRPPRGCRKNSA
jgi:glycosyltransferase involved in cell wall biosynthesis